MCRIRGNRAPASVSTFFARESKPRVRDAWIDTGKRDPRDGRVGLIGYGINFNRYLYRHVPPRPIHEMETDIRAIDGDIVWMLPEVTGPQASRSRRMSAVPARCRHSAPDSRVPKDRDLRTNPDVLYRSKAMRKTNRDKALRLIERQGLTRPKDLEAHGITRAQFSRLANEGLVLRQARGVYIVAHHAPTAEHTLAHVAKRVPHGIFCLLTALRFHGLTTQSPAEVWIALPEKAHRPRLDYPRLRVARFSGGALTEGVEEHRVEGVLLRIYSPAKTVADCFKYRNKIGIDVAVEALRDFSRKHRGRATDLARFARICRVSRVMQPYLDAIA